MKNKYMSSSIWTKYNREMIDWLLPRFTFWILDTKINPNEKPWKINAWIWILLWQLFKLPAVYHVCFPFPSGGITPTFYSVSAADPAQGTAGKGKIRKASLTSSWPSRMRYWRCWGCCPALQLYREKLIQCWKSFKTGYSMQEPGKTHTALYCSELHQACFE